MNSPLTSTQLLPEVHPREVPNALIDALSTRFGAQFSTALVAVSYTHLDVYKRQFGGHLRL